MACGQMPSGWSYFYDSITHTLFAPNGRGKQRCAKPDDDRYRDTFFTPVSYFLLLRMVWFMLVYTDTGFIGCSLSKTDIITRIWTSYDILNKSAKE